MSNASRTRTSQDTAGTQESRAKALQSAITAIEKAFGKSAIMRLGDNHGMAVERIPTGSLGLDIALGGGLPVGRITEIYGPESSDKTTVALSVIACAQHAGLQIRTSVSCAKAGCVLPAP